MADDDQGDLFDDDRPPFVHGSTTSEQAAEEIGKVTGHLRLMVFDLLCEYVRGLTDHQMQEILGMNPSTQRPRRIELVRQGWVIDSGDRRQTPSGRQAVVWKLRPPD